MSQFDVKMTELADKIKSKNTSVSGKLSVQGMIDAVTNISTGAELPEGITVTPADVKADVFYIDANGNKVEGTMPVHGAKNVTLTTNEQILPAGYYDRVTIPGVGSSSDKSDGFYRCIEVIDDNTWRGEELTWKHNVSVQIPCITLESTHRVYHHLSGKYVETDYYADKGTRVYKRTAEDVEIFDKIIVPPQSYVGVYYQFGESLYPTTKGATGYERQWAGHTLRVYFDTEKARWAIELGLDKDPYGWVAYAQEECINPWDTDLMFANDGYIEAPVVPEGGSGPNYYTNVNLKYQSDARSDFYPSSFYWDANKSRWYFSSKIGDDYDGSSLVFSAHGNANESATASEIAADFTTIQTEGAHDYRSDFSFGSAYYDGTVTGWESTGVIHDLTVEGYTPAIGEVYNVNTAAIGTLYPSIIAAFYKCASYDNGETIPAYSNLTLSGLTSPAEANGTYVVTDIEAEGNDRKWSNGDYTVSNSNYTWYIHKSDVTPNKINALYYAEVLPATTGEGTVENPKYWDSVITDTENRWATPVYNTGSFATSGNKCNFYVKLTAGTVYQMGVSANGNDNVVRLYDLAGEVLIEDDGNSVDINGITCSDSFSFTPTVTGVYRFEAGAWSTAVGDVQAVCFPAPEVANAPSKTEPWEIEWTVGGAEEGAYVITDAGDAVAIGIYTPSTETYDGNTIWTNTSTGAKWKADFSGSSWRWFLKTGENLQTNIYYENSYSNSATPWDVPHTQWAYGTKPYPTCIISSGYNASGTLSVAEVAIAERPATGKQVWTGYKATQNNESLKWAIADTITSDLQVKGIPPVVGYIYSADTTIQVANIVEDTPGQMVCLVHFDDFKNDSYPSFVDATDTCIVSIQIQSSIVTQDSNAKFGNGRWGGNYRALPGQGCFNIIGLPEISGDFTIEFWFYYSGYSDFGGTLVYTYTANEYGETQDVAEIKGENLAENHPQYRYKEWVHRAFVRKGTTVTEYINGVKVGTSEFTVALGGSRGLSITGGGVAEGAYDVRNYIDEFAIFNYAKYNLDFTPPVAPYPDIPSGLHIPDTQVGEVTVSGIKSIPWANSASYVLTNPDYDTEYPYQRVWSTADKKWYIYFDDMNGCWSIANTTSWDDSNHIEAAYITNDSADSQSGTEPIGNSGWRDSMGNKVKVIANS